jgi:hypothetical protein
VSTTRRSSGVGAAADTDGAVKGDPVRVWITTLLASGRAPHGMPPPEHLVHRARLERVHLLLASALTACGPLRSWLPDDLAKELTLELRMTAAQDAARSREVARVVTGLEAVGCSPMVIKGAALAHSHYRDPWLRPRVDTDLLIDADVHERATHVFARLGYERPPFVSGRLVMYQEMFVKAEAGGLEHVFDLHWRVANPQAVSLVLTHRSLLDRATSVDVSGVSVRVPCSVDALVLACVHRAAHHHDSEDLVWLYDIHLLAQGLSDSEWTSILARARDGAVVGLCARGLAMAAGCFGTHVPLEVAGALATPVDEPSRLFLTKGLRPLVRLASDLRALGPVDRLRLLHELLFPPRTYMREAFGNDGWLPWLYVRRVLGGARKWARPFRRVAGPGD